MYHSGLSGLPAQRPINFRGHIKHNDPCVYCGEPPKPWHGSGSDDPRTLDHIVPEASGGRWTYDNLAPACASCNVKKSSKPLLLFLVERERDRRHSMKPREIRLKTSIGNLLASKKNP